MRRLLPAVAAAVLPLLAGAAGAHASATIRVVRASADASVRADAATRPAGHATVLRVDGKPAARAYLRFRLTRLSGRVVRQAAVWVWMPKNDPWAGLSARGTNGRAWSESTLSWLRRPAVEAVTGQAVRASGRWRKLDVTRLVRQDGTVDVALTTTRAAGLNLASREAGGAHAPRLHLALATESQPKFPIRTALYDARYPAQWSAGTRYDPAGGHYDGANADVVGRQLRGLAYGRFTAAAATWDGPGTTSDRRLAGLERIAGVTRSSVRWAAAPTAEQAGNPSSAKIAALLARLDGDRGRDANYLRVHGRPVVFVPLAASDHCAAVQRWVSGNARQKLYLVMQSHSSTACPAKPSDWYGADPSVRARRIGSSAYVISPGAFDAHAAGPALNRDLPAWSSAVRNMAGAGAARWHVVDSYDGWSDGSAVEPASEWASSSGWGHYLDALHDSGQPPANTVVSVAAAGDIACSVAQRQQATADECRDGATAALIQSLNPTAVLALGDEQYQDGQLADWIASYDTTWGRFKSKTYPTPGNHEYCNETCADPQPAIEAGYYTYYGDRAGPFGRGYYSFDLGRWHLISLDSECSPLHRDCGPNSPQVRWLKADLAAHPTACTLAYFHRPRFTGGHEGEAPSMSTIWTVLQQSGVEVVLNGHQHDYERFRPQDADRRADDSGGITEFVAGTGGRSHIPLGTLRPNTIVDNADTFGVVRLSLGAQSFSWRFEPAPGEGSFTDAGSRPCH